MKASKVSSAKPSTEKGSSPGEKPAGKMQKPPEKMQRTERGASRVQVSSLDDLFVEELKDIYDAEQQILVALPAVSAAASSRELKAALDEHCRLTQKHVERLEQVFGQRGIEPERKKCAGIAGVLAEGEHVVKSDMPSEIKDAAIIAAAQRVEHYEMAAYGCLRDYARVLGDLDSARILQSTLDEEGDADRTLTQLAEFSINLEAAGYGSGPLAVRA